MQLGFLILISYLIFIQFIKPINNDLINTSYFAIDITSFTHLKVNYFKLKEDD